MAKIVSEQHLTGEKGVVNFNLYCLNHKPELLFREEQKYDYGVDGEVELTKPTSDGKREATGNIVKIQLKSTKEKSYIANESESSFDFIAKTNDIKYWNSHSLPVIVVIYFEKENLLFAKEINKSLVLKNRKTHKITFDKKKNFLTENTSFEEVTNGAFISRVDFEIKENLYFNLFKIYIPPFIKQYDSLFSESQKIFDVINENELYPVPEFDLVSKTLYTLEDLFRYNKVLRESVLDNDNYNKIPTTDFIKRGQLEKNIVIRLVNRYIKRYLYSYGIKFNKDYNRYYFSASRTEPLEVDEKENSRREVYRNGKAKTRTGRYDVRALVSKYVYYETTSFFRHLAFQLSYEWIDDSLYLIIDPKYLFTEDGITPLVDKKRITKLTNRLKQSERNTQYLNHLYFIRNYLSKSNITLFFESNSEKLEILRFANHLVNFGIREAKSNVKIKEIKDINQTSLFPDL